MKKILIRTGILPNESFAVEEYFKNNLIGGNVGNLLYTNSIIRNLAVSDDIVFESTRYKLKYKQEDIDRINSEYSAFIIPLADAFRKSFLVELKSLTNLIKVLTIPCYVIGVGLKDKYEPTFKEGFSFDEDVREFVSAVLEKSSIIGVRGQITSDYLTMLGFKEGKDHMPIGCPSMYTYGPNLHVEPPVINEQSHISLNASANAPIRIKKFIERTAHTYTNYTFVPQTTNELKYVYAGIPFKVKGEHVYIYSDSPIFEGDHIKFFLNIPTWFEYFDDIQLSVGSRLHGNVAALLNGTPSIFIPKDARERELDEIHHFNSFPAKSIVKKTTLQELIEKSDFSCFEKYQEENYKNFLHFLSLNNFEYVDQSKCKQVVYDNQIRRTDFEPAVTSFKTVSERERGERLYRMFSEDPPEKVEEVFVPPQKPTLLQRVVNKITR